MSKAITVQQTVQVIFGVERIRPGPGDTPEERAANGEVLQSLEFPNLILNIGLDGLFATPLRDMMDRCHVGSGTDAPAQTQEGLVAEVAGVDRPVNNPTNNNESPLYAFYRPTYTFAEGAAEGNLTEIGLSDGTASPTFLNRQLFRDGNGDPVTVTILADEILRVTAEARWYSDIQTDESTTGQFTYKGSTIDYTRTAVAAPWGDFSDTPVTNALNGTQEFELDGVSADSVSVASYTSGDYSATYTVVWEAGTLDGTYTTLSYARGCFEFALSPGLQVASTEELTLTVTRTWGRNP